MIVIKPSPRYHISFSEKRPKSQQDSKDQTRFKVHILVAQSTVTRTNIQIPIPRYAQSQQQQSPSLNFDNNSYSYLENKSLEIEKGINTPKTFTFNQNTREYKCHPCKMSFNRTWTFKRHLKIHSDDTKIYRC